jgi:DNA-binding transcriptional ArsR family regulator
MARAGMKGTEIARALNITHQRVYQHIAALREAGLLIREEASS